MPSEKDTKNKSRKFKVSWFIECEIELDSEVINRVDDEWRDALYNLRTPNEIVEHIAFNLVMNRVPLSHLDGWADLNDKQAKATTENLFNWSSEEITYAE